MFPPSSFTRSLGFSFVSFFLIFSCLVHSSQAEEGKNVPIEALLLTSSEAAVASCTPTIVWVADAGIPDSIPDRLPQMDRELKLHPLLLHKAPQS